MTKFDENKRLLLTYILKYVKVHLIEGKKFNTSRSGFGHDLNAYHYRNFNTGVNKDIFEQLHAVVPVLLTYWKGDATRLVEWLNDPLEMSLSGVLKTPPYEGVNRDLQWNLYYCLNNIKDDRQ